MLANTGHSVVFAVDNDTRHPVNISGGPLSYRYQFHEIHLHFGMDDRTGSEHTVDGHAFPAEVSVHFVAINGDRRSAIGFSMNFGARILLIDDFGHYIANFNLKLRSRKFY